MSLEDNQASQRAEARTQETRSFVRRVRAAARRRYTPEEKIRIVLEGFRREVTVNALLRLAETKPVVTYIRGTGASGAYYLSCGEGAPQSRHRAGPHAP